MAIDINQIAATMKKIFDEAEGIQQARIDKFLKRITELDKIIVSIGKNNNRILDVTEEHLNSGHVPSRIPQSIMQGYVDSFDMGVTAGSQNEMVVKVMQSLDNLAQEKEFTVSNYISLKSFEEALKTQSFGINPLAVNGARTLLVEIIHFVDEFHPTIGIEAHKIHDATLARLQQEALSEEELEESVGADAVAVPRKGRCVIC